MKPWQDGWDKCSCLTCEYVESELVMRPDAIFSALTMMGCIFLAGCLILARGCGLPKEGVAMGIQTDKEIKWQQSAKSTQK